MYYRRCRSIRKRTVNYDADLLHTYSTPDFVNQNQNQSVGFDNSVHIEEVEGVEGIASDSRTGVQREVDMFWWMKRVNVNPNPNSRNEIDNLHTWSYFFPLVKILDFSISSSSTYNDNEELEVEATADDDTEVTMNSIYEFVKIALP